MRCASSRTAQLSVNTTHHSKNSAHLIFQINNVNDGGNCNLVKEADLDCTRAFVIKSDGICFQQHSLELERFSSKKFSRFLSKCDFCFAIFAEDVKPKTVLCTQVQPLHYNPDGSRTKGHPDIKTTGQKATSSLSAA